MRARSTSAAGGAAIRHDYARIWRRLKPAERDRRISQALARLSEGETLAQVAATWKASAPTLCRALIAYAPQEWRRALAARALVRYEQAINRHTEEPSNPMTRARAWATRWHLAFALHNLAKAEIEVRGWEVNGRCPQCAQPRSVTAMIGRKARRPAWCVQCGWEGHTKRYLLDQLQVAPAGAASR